MLTLVLSDRSHLHLSKPQRVLVTMPSSPLDSVSVARMRTSKVATVEIGRMTSIVPPSALEGYCTITAAADVIVIVKRRETVTSVTSQRISYKFTITYSQIHHTIIQLTLLVFYHRIDLVGKGMWSC